MGHGLTRMYTRFFHFPMFQFVFDWQTTLLTALLCTFAAFAGTFRSLWLASSAAACGSDATEVTG